MPVINDATVVNSAYDTSGNGGRKLVRLANGWLVATLTNGVTDIKFMVSKNNGTTWEQLCYSTNPSGYTAYTSMVSVGNNIYFFLANSQNSPANYFLKIDATTVTNTQQNYTSNIDSYQIAFNGVSLAINEAGTELHAAWSSKNSTYPNSFNLRYAKGTINADGSVTWGAVEQVTKFNTNGDNVNTPSVLPNGKITAIYNSALPANVLVLFDRNFTSFSGITSAVSNWGNTSIYNGGSYAQSSPSAIFVPQSINGLANGRIWVAWHGTDSTDTTISNIRVSYSDDGGVTWSAMQKLTSGSAVYRFQPSITANKLNEVFVLFNNSSGSSQIAQLKWNGSWSGINYVSSGGDGSYPDDGVSTLFDNSFSLSFSQPIFIYRKPRPSFQKVGFYGSWTATSNSVPSGAIGIKSDRNNLLTYAITTDGTMSMVTEKVNGVTVATKTLTSGQSTAVSLTQAQWDAVKFGKYANATGGLNTLTVEMGTEKWTYTFNKNLASNADLLSEAKASDDYVKVVIPAFKSSFGSAIRSKGGTVNDTDSLDAMVGAIGGIIQVKSAKFTVSSNTTSNDANKVITLTGTNFTPKLALLSFTGNFYLTGGAGMVNTYSVFGTTDTTNYQNGSTIVYVGGYAINWSCSLTNVTSSGCSINLYSNQPNVGYTGTFTITLIG